MRLKIEEAFYSRPGRRQGERSIRLASQIEVSLELLVTHDTLIKAAPLTDALRRRSLSRRKYELLVAIITANSLATGQVDETAQVLQVLDAMWRRCPARWMPDLRPLQAWVISKWP